MIKVAVLGGGISSEREVSLSTAKQVMDNLNKEKFEPVFYDTKTDLGRFFADVLAKKLNVAFIALHGRGGEDGTIQGMLELLELPYAGPGVLASAIGMNKVVSKQIFEKADIPTAEYVWGNRENVQALGFPCVIKPVNGGSSIGISIAKNEEEFQEGLSKAFSQDKDVLVEKYIPGKEITVGVLGNGPLETLPVVEIVPKTAFFDYKAKYDPNFCQEIVPARISKEDTSRAQEIAKKVYKAVGCKGFSRVDMILNENGIYVLEINTIPGLTPNSLLPKAALAAGIPFDKLLEKIIMLAL